MGNKKTKNLSLEKKQDILSKIDVYLQSCHPVVFAFVHGSFLEEHISFRDIDIAVFVDESIKDDVLDYCLELSAHLSALVHITVDLHPLNDSTIGFCYEVTRGRLLMTRDDEKSFDFIEKARMDYFDIKPLLEENLLDLLHTV